MLSSLRRTLDVNTPIDLLIPYLVSDMKDIK